MYHWIHAYDGTGDEAAELTPLKTPKNNTHHLNFTPPPTILDLLYPLLICSLRGKSKETSSDSGAQNGTKNRVSLLGPRAQGGVPPHPLAVPRNADSIPKNTASGRA